MVIEGLLFARYAAVEFDPLARLRGLVFANQFDFDVGQVGCRDEEIPVVVLAELGRKCRNGAVTGCNVENTRAMRQLAKLIPPEIENYAVVVGRFTCAKRCDESLFPERGPLVAVVAADRTAPVFY